jgi:tetratricopeptide (TPR) repeat protein
MNVQEYFQRGSDFLNHEDFDRAIADFTKANRLDPNFAEPKKALSVAYFNRGVSYFQKGDSDQAIADLTAAISFNPNDATIYGARGMIYNQKGDYDGVIRDFTELIRLDPDFDAYISRQGGCYGKCKEYHSAGDESNFFKYLDLAMDDLNAALKINPNHDMVRKMLGHLTREREARKEAYKTLSELKGGGV